MLVKENFCFTGEQLVAIHIEEDPGWSGTDPFHKPEVPKPLLLHQNCLFQLIRISETIKHIYLTIEHRERPGEGLIFKMQWQHCSYSWDLLLAILTSVDVHKKEVFSSFSCCLSPQSEEGNLQYMFIAWNYSLVISLSTLVLFP